MPYLRSGLIPPFRSAALLFGVLSSLASAGLGQMHKANVPAKNNAAALKAAGQALPLVFEENAGQLPNGSAFAGRTRNYSVQVSPSELRFGLSGKSGTRTVSLAFSGSKDSKPEGVSEAGFRTNIYLGNNPRDWHTGIRNYDRVALRHLYPGVDAEFYARGQEIEHDFFVAPGADAAQLAMRVAGAKATTLSSAGDLLLTGEEGALRLHKPNAYQVLADGSHQAVDAQFTLAQAGSDKDAVYSLGFKLGEYDHSRTLVIDPVITYATYIAGASGATPVAMTLDTDGDVYLTGSTTSDITTFRGVTMTPAPVTGFAPPVPAAHTLTFVAQLLSNANGSRLNWLTYYGSNGGDVVPTAIALAPATSGTTSGANVYFAGNTLTGTLPGVTAASSQATITGAQAGYIAALNLGTGTAAAAPFTTYVDGSSASTQKTAIGALTVDTVGNVSIAGSSVGTAYKVSALSPAGPFCSSPGLSGPPVVDYPRGLIATISGDLTTRVYSSYVCGGMKGTTADFYSLTGISVVPSTAALAPTSYTIAGSTSLDFPKNGVYDATGVLPPGSFYLRTTSTSTAAFAAVLAPNLSTVPTVSTSFWSGGTGKDVANGLAVDSTGNIYVFGNTTSTDLAANAVVNGSPAPAGAGLSQTYPAPTGAGSAGFVATISTSNTLTGITYLSGPAADTTKTSSVNAAAADSSGAAIYLVGNTDEPEASFPLNTPATTPTLPYSTTDSTLSQDVSDPTAGTKRAFLLSMPPALTSVNYRAYFAPQAGTSSGVSVAYGNATTNSNSGGAGTAATSPFAFVLSSEQSTLPSYTTSSAADQQPPATATQTAYLAQVAYTRLIGATTPVLSVTTQSAAPNPVGYSTAYPAAQSTLTATWTLAAVPSADAPSRVVFNLPQSPYLATYTAGALTISGTEGTCTLGPNVTPPPSKIAGFTCIIPQLASGTPVTFTLVEPVTNAVNSAPGGSFNIPATAFDAQGDALNLTTNNVSVVAIPQFTLTNSVSPSTVNAARDSSDYGPGKTANTQVTYSYTVTNTNNVASTGVMLVTNLNTTTPGTSNYLTVTGTPTVLINGVAASCNPTAADGCAIPANGVLTYSITGIYLGSQFPANQNGQFAVSTAGPQINFPALGSTVTVASTSAAAGAVTVEVNGISVIKLDAITYGTYTYANGNLAGAPAANSFQLGDAVTLLATIENTGPNQAPSYNVTISLPQGFVVTTTPSGCTYTAATTAAVGSLACSLTNIPGNGSTTITIVGAYKDTGSLSTGKNADAVAAPNYSATPTPATVQGSPTFGSSDAYFTGSPSSQLADNIIVATGDSPHVTINVTRVNAIAFGVNVATPLGTTTINEKSPLDGMVLSAANPPLNDALTYTVNVKNTGKSVARGLFFAIPLPSLTSKVDGTSSTLAVSGLSFSPQLTCSYSPSSTAVTPNGPAVVCYETDLASVGAVPPTPITVPAPPSITPQAYSVSFTTSYSEASIGLNDTPPTTTVSQIANNYYAAADTYNRAGGVPGAITLNGTSPAGGTTVILTVQRQSTLIKTLTFAAYNTAPVLTNYFDTQHINLNEGLAGPGKNDTIIVRSQTYNAGPNDAAGVVITLPLPPYMVIGVPTGCKMTQLAAGGSTFTGPILPTAGTALTGAGGGTMVCNVPSSATPGGTATGQLGASVSSCAASADPASATMIAYDNKCFSVAFYAKFIDAPTDLTIVGANANASVPYSPQTSVENDIDTNVTTNSTFTASPAVQIVQRAAHVRLYSALTSPTYPDSAGTLLPKDSVSGNPEIAQAAARTTTGTVYNCLRYVINVVNDGPNYANHSVLNYTLSAGNFVPTQIGRDTPVVAPSVNCPVTASVSATDIGAVGPGVGSRATVFVDGFFNTGSLTTTNSALTTFQTGKFAGSGYNESNLSFAGSPTGLVPDYASSLPLTIVNTPFNDSTTLGFTIQPINTATPTAPVVTLVFNSVSAPGITSAFTSATTSCSSSSAVYNTCYPYGKSPVPNDLVPIRNLYQPGAHPLYYQVPSTATVPTTTGNSTSICIKAATTFPDIFVKPERTLLWVLTNGSANTSYNTFPTGFPAFSSTGPLVGDVTASVLPYGSTSYLQLPTTVTFAQTPQAQPGTICGVVNGLTHTNTADSTSVTAAQTFGLLEPSNFAPVVVAGAVPQSNTVSKGSTSALSDVFLNRSVVSGGVLSKANTYDYDDRDPCYIASNTTPRQTCDDNPYLYAVVFTGGHGSTPMTSPARVTSLPAETATAAPANSYNLLTSINLSINNAVYVAVADQAIGADAFNTDISSAVGYSGNPSFTSTSGNPFYQQGNFLLQNYSPSNTSSSPLLCDPGSAYLDYAVSATTVCKTSTGVDKGVFTGTGSGARYIRGGAKDPAVAIDYNQSTGINGHFYDLSNVGAVGVTVSGLTGSGLIALQQPGDPAIATATVTAGQTAGFYWPWLFNATTAGLQYDLTCTVVDSSGNPATLPAGVSCNISTVTPASATASSTVYTRGVSVDTSSTAPTIFVVTANGTLYAGVTGPAWKKGLELAGLAMLLPVLFFRRRLGKAAALAMVVLGLVAAPLLSGCGSGNSIGGTGGGTVTPAGTYLFRVTATQQGTTNKITSDPFKVIVQKGS